jgi:predicted Rossmann fold nucleotide-binding protein DprA/Smf involved in DNA uptake
MGALSFPTGRNVIQGAECATVGKQALLKQPLLALFCSIKCPGELILKLFDFAKELRDKGVGVVSGFHAPMDKECFDILLRGTGPIVWCPARSIETMRLKPAYKKAIDEGRLLILSSFPAKQSRISAERAETRNRLVAALAERVFVAYAEPGRKTEQLCREVVAWGKPLLTFDSRHNRNLRALGARVLTEYEIAIVEGRAK